MDLAKPPKGQRLPDIVTVEETRRLIEATRMLSYRMFFFTLYSLGRRLGEGLALTVADSDAARGGVHIRAGKGNEDRFVPLGDDAGVAASLLAAAPQSGATVSPSRGRTRGRGLRIHPAGSRRRAAGLAQGRRGVRA